MIREIAEKVRMKEALAPVDNVYEIDGQEAIIGDGIYVIFDANDGFGILNDKNEFESDLRTFDLQKIMDEAKKYKIKVGFQNIGDLLVRSASAGKGKVDYQNEISMNGIYLGEDGKNMVFVIAEDGNLKILGINEDGNDVEIYSGTDVKELKEKSDKIKKGVIDYGNIGELVKLLG